MSLARRSAARAAARWSWPLRPVSPGLPEPVSAAAPPTCPNRCFRSSPPRLTVRRAPSHGATPRGSHRRSPGTIR
ncbi:hypothetical protein Ae406Ps2_6444c [Pseudonocardia sp. Ae406_Ps2]|nr:hypothetical protein Ae331Ps2_6375 [Pseudonocardia sp. Ae331_Ps2]OLL89472.1 hypothetical protein Ae406Ps2_6444c [Pseudonocardia sp. Ae406_Ps2]